MGRWAQQKRRGGGGSGGAAPALISVVSVELGAVSGIVITFSAPITYDNSGSLTGFSAALGGVNTVTTLSATELAAECDNPVGHTDPWDLPTQPPEITEALAVPTGGNIP